MDHREADDVGVRALHRIATLVAAGIEPQDLFAVVAEEVASCLGVPIVNIARYESDGTATGCASFAPAGPLVLAGSRWSLGGTNVLRLILASSAAARIDDFSGLEGELAALARERGIRSTVGNPITVEGRLWGAILVSSTHPDRLPGDTEPRLAEFTALIELAIANAESRNALTRVVDEQAALRRVATQVARGVPAPDIFRAVSEEVAQLFGEGLAAVGRFDTDHPAVTFVGIATDVEAAEIGTSVELSDETPTGRVYATRRPARVDRADWSTASSPMGRVADRLGIVSIVSSPIIVDGRLWGATSALARTQPLPADTEGRLERFSELIAMAIANTESRTELAASRRRIVAASDDARRRIERNLHDGTQQRLIALGLSVRAAEADLPPELDDLRNQLAKIAAGLTDAAAELQEISRGIHPANLAQTGLGPALRTLARRSPIPVDLDNTIDGRLPEPVEVATYYVASETLANAAKHAEATRIDVSLRPRDDHVVLSISDDGIGGADPARGSGLVGLIDRVAALGGSLNIHSVPGHGTRITAQLPLEPGAGPTAA